MLAKQVLYHWSHTFSPFSVVILEVGPLELLAWTGLEL
jgi:hypothetical protein